MKNKFLNRIFKQSTPATGVKLHNPLIPVCVCVCVCACAKLNKTAGLLLPCLSLQSDPPPFDHKMRMEL